MATANGIEEYLQRIRAAEFEYCRNDVVYWANNYCVIEDKDSPEIIVPFKGWDAQNQTLKDFAEHRLNLILKARQMGITWIALYFCLHDLIFNLGHTVVALSKTEDDAKELVRRMSVVLDNMPQILKGGRLHWWTTATSICITDDEGKLTSTFKAFPASPSAGRSFTGNILLLDEWAFQQFAEEIWTSAYPTINRPTGGKVIGLSTIKKGTLFESLWVEDNAFHKIFLSVFCDPRRTKEWYEQTAKDLGVKVKQEYPRTAEEALANLGGSYFSEFDSTIHVCEPFPIPKEWRRWRAFDYGLDRLACMWVAMDSARNVYVYKEYCESNLPIYDAAKKMLDMTLEDEEIYATLAPPDMWGRSQETGRSKAQIFYESGLTLTKSSNDREAGWLAIKELLRVDANGEARLHIFRNCTELIKCLPSLQIDEKRPSDCAIEPHEITHAPDALRYWAIGYNRPTEPAAPKKVKYRADILEDYFNASEEERALIVARYGEPDLN
jgi:hypothetical protein